MNSERRSPVRNRVTGLRGAAVAVVCAGVIGSIWFASGRELLLSPRSVNPATQSAVQVEPRSAEERERVIATSADVWTEHPSPDGPIVVVLSPSDLTALRESGVPHRVLIEDIQAVANAERLRLRERVRGTDVGDEWFSEYRDIQELSDYMDLLGDRYPQSASLRRLGSSVDGWPIRAIKVSRGGDIKIVINGGHHAREWISVMVPMCIAERLLRADAIDPRVRRILDSVTFYIVPLVNPDGYLHSWNADRYWRKNRRGGHGVDLNRNYSVAWGKSGSSGNKRSQTYRGERAFSEPESRAMRDLFLSEDITAHVDFHSYSQLILYPWSHKRAAPEHRDKFAAIADRMASAMVAEHGVPYKIRPGSELRGGASGTLIDWSYGEAGALSFLIELRPASRLTGFVLPPEQIVPSCEESLAAVLEVADWMIADRDR